MIDFLPQPIDVELVANLIQPSITKKQVRNSIKLLLNLGLIEKLKNDSYRKKDTILTTDNEVRGIQIINFHKQMAELADSAIERFPFLQRDISGIILCAKSTTMPKIKQRIEEFRNDLVRIASADNDADAVFYVQIRAFPLTKQPKGT
jgi:uncharacterized protein (TIGR02147 family)